METSIKSTTITDKTVSFIERSYRHDHKRTRKVEINKFVRQVLTWAGVNFKETKNSSIAYIVTDFKVITDGGYLLGVESWATDVNIIIEVKTNRNRYDKPFRFTFKRGIAHKKEKIVYKGKQLAEAMKRKEDLLVWESKVAFEEKMNKNRTEAFTNWLKEENTRKWVDYSLEVTSSNVTFRIYALDEEYRGEVKLNFKFNKEAMGWDMSYILKGISKKVVDFQVYIKYLTKINEGVEFYQQKFRELVK
ncbi:MAG: hypothetical protein AAFO96_03890 [Bacteroidota bacterium]